MLLGAEWINMLKIDGYDTKISDIIRIITLKDGNDTYNFLVDSNYKIQQLDGVKSDKETNASNDSEFSSSIINNFEVKVEEGDVLLLCSDGLTNMVEDSEIEKILEKHKDDMKLAGENLVWQANEAGGKDNISVILVRL